MDSFTLNPTEWDNWLEAHVPDTDILSFWDRNYTKAKARSDLAEGAPQVRKYRKRTSQEAVHDDFDRIFRGKRIVRS